ncbi:MAG: isoprenylcysteine carboxylmethyltransferase family protein [Planctomycetales bacterium]|nr:isoprenylcysteine carboxylmethyltransferase family protein [Planctomycetales bacterium]
MRSNDSKLTWRRQWIAWLVGRRITVSLACFTILIAFNLFVLHLFPLDPLGLSPLSNLGTGLVLVGIVIRSWAAGTLHKSRELTQIGPYALVRNPLYVGSFLMMFGFCVLLRNWLALAFAVGPMSVLYWYQVRAEEKNLQKWFPEQWDAYVARTGRFLPIRIGGRMLEGWTYRQWLKNREYRACGATIMAIVIVSMWTNSNT